MEPCEALLIGESIYMSSDANEVLTVGHSALSLEHFVALLRNARVTAIADVRTAPYSRRNPQFNREALSKKLRSNGFSYVFLGRELGGRPREPSFYCNGVADYEKMAQTNEFNEGLDRIVKGTKKYRVALMCSERDPLDCHRCLLVGRALAQRDLRVGHILHDGEVVSHTEIEDALLKLSGSSTDDLFSPRSEQLAKAYRERAQKVAFIEPKADPKGAIAAE
jgi:uncharacterized protein (DUF488 family)